MRDGDAARLDADVRSGFRGAGPWVEAHEQLMAERERLEAQLAAAENVVETARLVLRCSPIYWDLADALDRLDQEKPDA